MGDCPWTSVRRRSSALVGLLQIPPGVEVKVNDVCELHVSDGRVGRIRFERVNITNQGTFVSFAAD